MCRIAGGYDTNNSARLKNVEAMNDFQKRGGPDGGMVMDDTDNHITFGHRRLSIIDLTESGRQPMTTQRYVLTYNGEWYDYKDHCPTAKNDTLALLESIDAIGINKTLSIINGMFAFAVFDEYEQEIHLAVDRFAQKPLYYYHKDNRFYFASWPAALYDLETSWRINNDALQSYWLLGSVMGEDSIFCGIKKLNASEHLTYSIRENKIKIECYWEPQYEDKTDNIEELVVDAIRLTKVSDVPIHIFLSGGIDSTLVASQNYGGQAIHLDSPELEYAQLVADKFKINLRVIKPETIKTEEYLNDYSRQCGEPTMAGIIPYTTAKETAKFGKVAITANGADELFFGYDRMCNYYAQKDGIYRASAFKSDSIESMIERNYNITRSSEGKAQKRELYSYVQFDLNKTLDFASMCHGLEVRSPFLDHRLVEMALSIHEQEHRRNGNKTILKNILRNIGFNDVFLNRPKLGFSLFSKPENLDRLIINAWDWVHENGFLNVKGLTLSGRDKKYLEMSALGFYYWFKAWKHKIK
jgi:asparagine synthase (glutamine-hydrolysing)